MQREQNGCEKF